MHSGKAVDALGADLANVAAAAGIPAAQLRRELTIDPSLWLDRCGSLFYVETAPTTAGEPAAEVVEPGPEDALNLHSRPGSNRTLLLDFDGHFISGTAWNSGYGLAAWNAPAFSIDSDPTTLSLAERRTIVEIWARVADDFAPFDVDVTTVDPGEAALARTSTSDLKFGARALISPDAGIARGCGGCGGVAYVNVFDSVGSAAYAPAWVLAHNLGNSARYIAEAASHEVGHNFGLYHDGVAKDGTTTEYYSGSGDWAPIMGVGYYQRVTQWSRGEYPGATRSEDDTRVIASGGAPWLADDLPGTAAAARPSPEGLEFTGVIGGQADVDWVSLTGSGTVTVTAAPSATAPNLDLGLTLATPEGQVLATSDPPYLATKWPASAGASVTATLPGPGTYAVGVSGVGNGLPGTDGATDYGSLGRYRVSITLPNPEIQEVTIPPLTVGAPFSQALVAAGGSPPYAWSVAAGTLPPGLELVGERITGSPRASGASTTTVTVTDSAGHTDSHPLQFLVAEAPRLASPATWSLVVGQRVQTGLYFAGGVTPYTWSAQGLPPGVRLAAGQITGTLTTAGTYQATVRLTDANGATAEATTLWVITAPVSPQNPEDPSAGLQQAGQPATPPPTPAAQPQPAAPATSPAAPPGSDPEPYVALSARKTTKLPTARRKQAYQATLGATGGTAPLTYQVVAGRPPAGLVASPSGQLAGIPRKKGSFRFTVAVRDATGASARTTYRIKVR